MKTTPYNQLAEIKDMMEKSSRFISLSGLSGISVGIIALLGALYAFFYLNYDLRYFQPELFFNNEPGEYMSYRTLFVLTIDAMVVLTLAIASALFFTIRKARKKELRIWNHVTRLLLINLFLPLSVGGIFCVILGYYKLVFLIAPSTLIFYGLALLNASKYTFSEIKWLGLCETCLGLIAMVFAGYGLIAWSIGFGVLHIIYGIMMYLKYDIRTN